MATRNPSAAPARLFVDSGAWLAFFSARDRKHPEADRLIRDAMGARTRLVTTNLVLAEVHRLLLFRAGIKPAAEALARVEASPNVQVTFVDQALHKEARGWLAKLSDQVISYTDAASFAVMKANRCSTALSFDNDFIIAGFSLWRSAA